MRRWICFSEWRVLLNNNDKQEDGVDCVCVCV